ncbi:MAG: glycosyltransferase [Bacteroidaceae bacterium]|nr:glycosyltransferase [Bacteroidaceae bacterium]
MKSTIIIPTYQPGEYIYECLGSITKQTLPAADFETIIILNGPKEPYYTQIKEYVDKYDSHNFTFIYTNVPGVSNARNVGLDNAKGEYITFVDDDDIISSEYLEELLAVSSPTCVGVSNGYAFINNIGERIETRRTVAHSRLKNEEFSFTKFRIYLSPPVFKVIHRDIIGSTRFNTSMHISEDSLFCFAISKNIKSMKCADDSAIYYVRRREGSATRRTMKKSYIISLTFKKFWLFTKIYFSNPFRYNFPFYITRLMACIKHARTLLNDSKKYSKLK